MNILSFQIHMRIKIATYNVLNGKINTNVPNTFKVETDFSYIFVMTKFFLKSITK